MILQVVWMEAVINSGQFQTWRILEHMELTLEELGLQKGERFEEFDRKSRYWGSSYITGRNVQRYFIEKNVSIEVSSIETTEYYNPL